MIDFEIGAKGVELSFQGEWLTETPCCKCQKTARLAFVVAEGGGKIGSPYICELHQNMKDQKFWLHDSAAFATYLCTDIKCATATTHWNQA